MPPSDHPNTSGYVGLGGHHLTAHRSRLHSWITSFLSAPLRVQNPLYQEPAAELPARGVVHMRPAELQKSQCKGLCEPDQHLYFTPKRRLGLVFIAERK